MTDLEIDEMGNMTETERNELISDTLDPLELTANYATACEGMRGILDEYNEISNMSSIKTRKVRREELEMSILGTWEKAHPLDHDLKDMATDASVTKDKIVTFA